MNRIITQQKKLTSRTRQRGVVLVLVTVGMLVIIVMGGLALDVSHALLNKSRLQNTVDAAALTAAKTLGQTSDTTQARAAAVSLFTNNAGTAGNGEMAADIDASEVIVEFSATLEPFAVGSSPAEYVRVKVDNFTLGSWLIQLMGIDEKIVRASAVAGPSPTLGQACDIVPLIVCGDPDAGGPLWGFEPDDITVLKSNAQSGGGRPRSPIGPGNFQLARLGGPGGSNVRDNLAGSYEGCIGDVVETQPGNVIGPTRQGLNTRFDFSGGSTYPPDVVVEQQTGRLMYDETTDTVSLNGRVVSDVSQLDFDYEDYRAAVDAGPTEWDNEPPAGAFDRRNLAVLIADCEGSNNGQSQLPVLGLGCYFLLQDQPNGNTNAEVIGQFVEECDASGNVGPDPQDIDGPVVIQLYKDADSRDS